MSSVAVIANSTKTLDGGLPAEPAPTPVKSWRVEDGVGLKVQLGAAPPVAG